jgi:EAL domain-containing protein (putative c-di-GMP-specific phosphodiesterase class I)
VARLGGDEFVVMLEDTGEGGLAATHAETVATKIQSELSKPYLLSRSLQGDASNAITYHGSSSIGIAMYRSGEDTVDDLLKRADLAMYQAKAAGRNTLRFFDPKAQALAMARASMEAEMRESLEKQDFRLFYQIQVDQRGQWIGVEALLRWQHPQRGMVSPVEFIPLAEDTGLILPLGYWVLETACRQLVDWASVPEREPLCIAVNVSARQFKQADFVEQVLEVLRKTRANPNRLKLELTESMLLDNIDNVIEKMRSLRDVGIGFSLDDFGTGYSSLSYLKRLPFDQLKIDASFVRDVLNDKDDAAIVKTIVALGESLGMSVIAEGVETQEQRDYLEQSGCLLYQGYLFGRPVPIESL